MDDKIGRITKACICGWTSGDCLCGRGDIGTAPINAGLLCEANERMEKELEDILADNERLRDALKPLVDSCAACNGGGEYPEINPENGEPTGFNVPCEVCTLGREELFKGK